MSRDPMCLEEGANFLPSIQVHWSRLGLSFDSTSSTLSRQATSRSPIRAVWLGLHLRGPDFRAGDLTKRWLLSSPKGLGKGVAKAVDAALEAVEADLSRQGAPLTKLRRREADASEAASHIARAMAQVRFSEI